MGYSLGSAIVLDYVLQSPNGLRGAILSAAAIEPAGVATPLQIALARLLSRVWPTFTIKMTNDIHGVSRDETVLQALEQDPLHHHWVTARWGTESLLAIEPVRACARDIQLPVLFIHGGDDPYNLVGGTQNYFEQITYPDKTLKIYPGGRHETHNDFDHAKVAKDIIEWMKDHYIICGYGRVGHQISKELEGAKVPFVVIDAKEEIAEEMEETLRVDLPR